MIYVTLGTMFLDFKRLVDAMDQIASDTDEEVLIQTGLGKTIPKHCKHFDFESHDDVLEIQQRARVIVCHAGIGCVLDALGQGKPLIVVPRLKQFDEHMNDHQLDLAEMVRLRGWGHVILDIKELAAACARPLVPPKTYRPAKRRLIDSLRYAIDCIAARK